MAGTAKVGAGGFFISRSRLPHDHWRNRRFRGEASRHDGCKARGPHRYESSGDSGGDSDSSGGDGGDQGHRPRFLGSTSANSGRVFQPGTGAPWPWSRYSDNWSPLWM
jgi:hypothetical protein